ncbi:MAG: hypothetical protein KAR05_09100 [Candidatus Omnitrophica bacterium]|nr:hypothetical protein [Candidatus Omnitrophota bacterium]
MARKGRRDKEMAVEIRKILMLIAFCLFFSGCTVIESPLYGTKYVYYGTIDKSENPKKCYKFYTMVADPQGFKDECRQYFVMQNKSWSEDVKELILKANIAIGMTREQVLVSWGEPDDINRTGGGYGVHEQWVYDRSETYLYFENGILTSWQD